MGKKPPEIVYSITQKNPAHPVICEVGILK